MQLRYFIFCLLLFFVCLTRISAQVKINGIITDSASKEKLAGATVILHSNKHNYRTTSDANGVFSLDAVAPGSYSFDINFIGFQNFSRHLDVDSKNISLNIYLTEKTVTLQTVNIFTSLNGELEASSRLNEKNANNIVNVISAQAIQRSSDINAANVLQRMSGVTLQKNSGADEAYAIVRGLEPRYNNTLVNGVKITSPDEKSRYVSLDVVPSDLLQKIEISKSLLPEMEGDAIGGTVNLVMKDAPDTSTFIVSGALGYSKILLDRKYTYFSTNDIEQKSLNERFGSSYVAQPDDFSRSNLDFKQKTAFPTGTAGITYGTRFMKGRAGIIVSESFQNQYYGTNSMLNTVVPDTYLAMPAISDVSNREFSTQQLNNGITLHADYNINSKNKITVDNVFLYSYLEQARVSVDTAIKGGNGGRTVPGTGPVTTDYTSITSRQYLENLKVGGSHILSNHLLFDWAGVYSIATKRSPDRADLAVNKKIDSVHTTDDPNGPYTFTVTPDYFDEITRIWQHNNDEDYSAIANISYKTTWHQVFIDLKAGGLYRHKQRYNLQDEYDLKPTTNSNGVKQVFTNIYDAQWIVYNPAGTYDYDVNNYYAHEDVTAGFAEAKISSEKFDVFGGVRTEKTNQGFHINTFYAGNVNAVTKDYTDVLPSIMVKYKLNNKTNIRASYFKSISRPNYYELVPYKILGTSSAHDEQGNPNLKHSIANNFDLRYELYPHKEDQLFIGGFYKRIQDPIESEYVDGTTYQPVNLGTATLYGGEIVYTKNIGNFGVTGNYTYIYSKIFSTKSYTDLQQRITYDSLQKRPMQGQTGNTVNLSVFYHTQDRRLFIQVAYQYLGLTLDQVYPIFGDDYYQQPQSFLSASADYGFAKHFTVFGKFNNLLNTPTYYKISTLTVGKDVFESEFLIGVRYSN
jgi:TonB-dependent receptor